MDLYQGLDKPISKNITLTVIEVFCRCYQFVHPVAHVVNLNIIIDKKINLLKHDFDFGHQY